MKATLRYAMILSLLVAAALMGTVPEAMAGMTRPGFFNRETVAQKGRGVTGFFKSLNTKGRNWTVTVESLDHGKKRTYRLSGQPMLTYRGEFRPWQKGIVIDSIVELIFNDGGEVATINVLNWAS